MTTVDILFAEAMEMAEQCTLESIVASVQTLVQTN